MAHGDRSVDVFVRKVRQKLEKASPDWSYIHTHFGVGYRFDPEQRGEPAADAVQPPETAEAPVVRADADADADGGCGCRVGPAGLDDDPASLLAS